MQTNVFTDNELRQLLAGTGENFVWITHKRKLMRPRNMATPHLFYTVRMLFNHSVAPCFRVGQFIRYKDVPTWTLQYKRAAAVAMLTELSKREDLDSEDQHELDDMNENAQVMRRLGLQAD